MKVWGRKAQGTEAIQQTVIVSGTASEGRVTKHEVKLETHRQNHILRCLEESLREN